MLLSEKLEKFLSEDLTADIDIQSDAMNDNGIKFRNFPPTTLLCEKHVNFESQIILGSAPSFIGSYSYMNDGGYLRDLVFIGRFCSIGRRVSIGAAMHPVNSLSTSPYLPTLTEETYTEAEKDFLFPDKKSTRGKFTVIENDVWIGDGAIILPGVHIGTGAVVAANSVISKNVAPYQIVGGIPQRNIRMRFPSEVIARLLGSRWWEIEYTHLSKLNTRNILLFLSELNSRSEFIQQQTYSITQSLK